MVYWHLYVWCHFTCFNVLDIYVVGVGYMFMVYWDLHVWCQCMFTQTFSADVSSNLARKPSKLIDIMTFRGEGLCSRKEYKQTMKGILAKITIISDSVTKVRFILVQLCWTLDWLSTKYRLILQSLKQIQTSIKKPPNLLQK